MPGTTTKTTKDNERERERERNNGELSKLFWSFQDKKTGFGKLPT
jgi:hypothetical protein